MFPIVHYLKGILKNLFNSRISIFAIVSVNVKVDKTAYIYRGIGKDRKNVTLLFEED